MRSKKITTALTFATFGATLFATPSSAVETNETTASRNCFDAEVYATVTQEIPSVIPDVDDGTIVMEWPWFLDLRVERVLYGSINRGTVSVLAVQHTYIAPSYKLWWLKRNSMNGFNVVGYDEGDQLRRCPAGTAPAAPYIHPGEGQTLDDLRQAGERRYGRFP